MTTLVPGRGFKRKGEKTQAKYLSGLSGEERKAREDEIVRRSRLYRKDPSHPDLKKPLPGDAEAKKSGVRRSRWTTAYKSEYGEESGGSPEQVAKDTGIPASITRSVYRRGVGAAKSAGHRPGVTKGQWGLARLYAFVMKAKHNKGPLDHDHDLAIEAGLAKREESDYNPRHRSHGGTMLRNLLEAQIVSEPAAQNDADLDSGFSEGDVPTDPRRLAFKHMEDAARSEGLLGMIAATEKRVKATAEKAKLQGVVDAIEVVVRELNAVSKLAASKAK